MSEEKKKPGIYVRATGKYIEKTLTHKISRDFDVTVMLTDNTSMPVPSERRLHYLVMRKLLPNHFETNPDKYVGYEGLRECVTHGVEIVGKSSGKTVSKKPIEKMSFDDMVTLCIEEDLNTNPKTFPKVGEARQAVIDELENRKIAIEETRRREIEQEEAQKADESDIAEFLSFNKIQ